MLIHIASILRLDSEQLNKVLDETGKCALKLTAKDREQLEELATILNPFLEATNTTQGQKVPAVVGFQLSVTTCDFVYNYQL